jgi:leucyl aminopeptidase
VNSFPHISCIDLESANFLQADSVAIPVLGGDKAELGNLKLVKLLAKATDQNLQEAFESWPDATGKAGELFEYPIKNGKGKLSRIYFVGVGTGSSDDLRKSASALARKVKASGALVIAGLNTRADTAVVHTISLILSSYTYTLKSEKPKKSASFQIVGNFESEVSHGKVLATGVWRSRDLIHTPSNIKNPLWMANQVKSFVTKSKSPALTVKVKSGKELAEFGGLRAVGNSVPVPGPRLIEISYAPKGSSRWPHVVLVGKGITFDTGGISLKRPYENMVAMKTDMSGAAAVMATILTIADLGKDAPKVRITGLMMCAENSLSATSQRPSDVIRHYGGTTVEVLDTDAEGRLVLADGLAYADAELDPDYLIDIATLTGSATLGLGRQYAAMYTRNNKLAKTLNEIGEQIGERLWHMPLIDDYKVALVSDIADFNHLAENPNQPDFSAGSVTAALFLEHFAGSRNWVHLDIAGPARSESDSGENPKGGTGFGVRVLTEWLTSL